MPKKIKPLFLVIGILLLIKTLLDLDYDNLSWNNNKETYSMLIALFAFLLILRLQGNPKQS